MGRLTVLDDSDLLKLAGSVSDAVDVDWDQVLAHASTDHDKEIVRGLMDLSRIAASYRRVQCTPEQDTREDPLRSGNIPRNWGHLRILEKLGEGAASEVYLALDEKLDRQVALKLLKPSKQRDDAYKRSVVREGCLLARIRHPNVATVYGADEHDGRIGIWLELIRGKTLSQIFRDQGPFGEQETALIGLDICRALSAVHALDILHRDIKAQNIIREKGGRIVLMDFGIGVDLHAQPFGFTAGTPCYMAPEIFAGHPPSKQSDIYSVGVLLYYLLTGDFPVRGESVEDLALAHRTGQVCLLQDARPTLSEGTLRIVERALALDPKLRYRSAGEMARELASAAGVGSGVWGTRFFFRRAWAFVLAGIVIGSLAFLYWRASVQNGAKSASTPYANDLAARPSIAVLPFQNRTGDSALDWLRIGLADLLATDLAQSPQVQVVATEASYEVNIRMERTGGDVVSEQRIREIGRAANVDQVIAGSFFKAGELLRVSTQLHEGETGRLVATYLVEGEGEASLFSLADQLSGKVKTALRVAPAEDDLMDQELADVTTASSEAFRYYAEALVLQYRGKNREAIPLLERAVEIDPQFAMALTKLSILFMHEGRDQTAFEYSRRAYENMDRIPARDRLYIEGNHFSWREETYSRAIDAYRRVIDSYPDHFPARNNLAGLYSELEYYEKAIEMFESMKAERPDLLIPYYPLSLCFTAKGEFQRGYDVLVELRERGGNEAFAQAKLGDYFVLWGRVAEAKKSYDSAFRTSHGLLAAEAFWRSPVLEEDRKELDRWIGRAMNQGLQPLSRAHNLAIALLYAGRSSDAERVLLDASQSSVESGRDRAACHRLAAHVFLERGDAEGALEQARLAIQDGAGDIGEWEGLVLSSIAHAQRGRWEEAEKVAEVLRSRSVALLGDRSRRRNHHLAGTLALMRGQTALAIEELEKAAALLPARGVFLNLTLPPDHVPIWFSLASTHLASGDHEKATRYLERIVESEGERLLWPIPFVRSLYLLAKIHEARGDEVSAQRYLERTHNLWQGGDMDLKFRRLNVSN